MPLDVDLSPIDSFGPGLSSAFFWIVSLMITIPFLFSLRRYFVFRARAKEIAKKAKEPRPLAPGPILVEGVVETDNQGPAVRIAIAETGREWSNKGRYGYEWTEVARQVNVQPFRLRLPDDTAIEVRPDDRIRLVDKLVTESYESMARTRVAELSHGERAWIRGVLSFTGSDTGKLGAYRRGRADAVVTGARMEPLEVSTGALDARFRYWRRFEGYAALILGAFFLFTHTLALGAFEAKWLFGKVETPEYIRTRSYTTSGKYGPMTHYVVEGIANSYPNMFLSGEVSRSQWEAVKRADAPQVPYMVVPWAPEIHSIGTFPDQPILWSVFAILINGVAVLMHIVASRSAAPWYEQRKVVEKGEGRLSDRAYDAQVPGTPGLYVREDGPGGRPPQ